MSVFHRDVRLDRPKRVREVERLFRSYWLIAEDEHAMLQKRLVHGRPVVLRERLRRVYPDNFRQNRSP